MSHNFFQKHVIMVNQTAPPALALLQQLWTQTDDFFERQVTSKDAYKVPISLRMPYIFYIGHLSAFAANKLLPEHVRDGMKEKDWHWTFSRGIDPDVEDSRKCHEHPPPPPVWPSWSCILAYRDAVRQSILSLPTSSLSPRPLFMVSEHDAMHFETLHYMYAQQSRIYSQCCHRQHSNSESRLESEGNLNTVIPVEWCLVPEGVAVTGITSMEKKEYIQNPDLHFVWDNELDTIEHKVDQFQVSKYAVTNGEMMAFILCGGYQTKELWTSGDWNWVQKNLMRHPASWECGGNDVQGLLASHVLTANRAHWYDVKHYPVSVSLAEARAYARWRNARLPTELEWVRAAWNNSQMHSDKHDNHRFLPSSDIRSDGPHDVHQVYQKHLQSWTGAVGMIGNGWEFTETLFESFEGFQPMPDYPEYSADFFDGKHFVLRGGSWVTHPRFVRPSFRNFYQARYPYVFSKIRLAKSISSEESELKQ